MKFTVEELTRLIGYIAGIAAGLGFIAFGLINGDLPTALAGAGMLGLGGVAGYNINKSQVAGTPAEIPEDAAVVPATEFEVVPTALPDDVEAKHA